MSRRGVVGSIVAVALAAPVVAIAAAWLATPGIGDLAPRVAQRTPPPQVHGVAADSVTRLTVDALVATEDERYWSNSGIDVIGLMRAIPYDAVHLSLAQGGSTLTEQLAKNLWLEGNDQRVWSKLQDMALALKLDHRYSKDTILSAYLNTAYFGQGAYGIERASRRYFGIAPSALDPAEATVLVGLVQAPTSYDPYTHPAASRLRQIDVLRSLVRVGKLPVATAARLLAEPLRLADGRTVPGLEGVDLSPGPAIAWPDLTIAIAAVLAAGSALVLRHRTRLEHPLAAHLASIAAVALVGAALVEAVRSVRVA